MRMRTSTVDVLQWEPTPEHAAAVLKAASRRTLKLDDFDHTWAEAEARFEASDVIDNLVMEVRGE